MLKTLKQNEKLIKILSIVSNVILLIIRIAFVIFLYCIIKGIYQGARNVNESGGDEFYYAGILSFLVVFAALGMFIFIIKSIVSATIIIIGAVFSFNKVYTTLSVAIALFDSTMSLSLIRSQIETIKSGDFNIYNLIGTILLIGFSIFNAVIQILLHKIVVARKAENKEDDDVNNKLEEF